MSELAIAMGGFFVMGALCTCLESIWPEDGTQPKWRHDTATDVAYFAIRVLLSALLVFLTAFTGSSIPHRSAGLTAGQPFWLQVVEVLLLTDLIAYWVHRISHEIPFLWRIHTIHHSAEQVDWLVAARNHPLELVIQKMAGTVPLYLLGFNPEVFAAVVPLVATYSLFQHANLTWDYGPFRYVLASPAFHRWHHSSQQQALDKNYAPLFPFYDYLFGTAYFPKGVYPEKYGLKTEKVPRGILNHMAYPFTPASRPQPVVPPSPSPNHPGVTRAERIRA
jgi:sterol desaturase/sphingolipid hydroxylase (fatty acid hydroxylase superfamily)